MKLIKLILIVSVAALISAITISADAIGPSATGAGHFQTGSPPELRTFSFTARTDSSNNTIGQAQLDNRAQNAVDHLTINCLNVVGNVATMSGVVEKSTVNGQPGFPKGTSILFRVVDNGEGANAPADEMSLVYLNSGISCNAHVILPLNPIDGGNVQVRAK
jgi:hypothetical protein